MLDKELLHILQHSLGVNQYGQGRQYRNHYVAGFDDQDKCRELVALGYMTERTGSELTGGDPIFLVSAQGRDAVALESPSPPKKTRSQRRYEKYLASEPGMPFGEWLKRRE